MTLCTIPSVTSRPCRRPGRPPGGKLAGLNNRARDVSAKVRSTYRRSLDPCDNSNDSGIDFDHHMDHHQHLSVGSERLAWTRERAEPKRPKLDIKLENDDVNDSYCFPDAIRTVKDNVSLIRTAPTGSVPSLSINSNPSSASSRSVPRCTPLSSRQNPSGAIPLTSQLPSSSRYMDVSLTIVKQPEQQHRARYQTEGSRGAVKDRDGNGFPVVRLTGYYKPTTLQVFIGTDVGKVSPHMFYQACKVSGKNSTPCLEKKLDGTCVIEVQLDPSKEMSATCDCVGILKERNVDVEHRFPDQLGNRSKKKSTRCRMIFRTHITLDDGSQETLQVCSQPIVCTQPPGIPEICKKSLTSCPASGGLELFVLGKNFLKDTKVYFQQFEDGHVRWEQSVAPDKEYLQQTHFVCVVPPYRRPDVTEPVSVRLCVVSSGKTSEYHQFVYTPVNGAMPSGSLIETPASAQISSQTPFFKSTFWQTPSSLSQREHDMMPPPESSLVPTRRPSLSVCSGNEMHSPPLRTLKQEYIDENSQSSIVDHERYRRISESSLDVHHGDSNMSMINDNSMDIIHQNSMMSSSGNENSNLSVGTEDSVDVMKCMSASVVCDSSLDCSTTMSTINEESSMQCESMLPQVTAASIVEKVMDLRMKLPMATVADLVNTTAPSMAALQKFGMMEPTGAPLPTQSAQSVESYLTGIETNDINEKISQIIKAETAFQQRKAAPQSQVISSQTCGLLTSTRTQVLEEQEPVYLTSSRPFFSNTTQNDAQNIVAKSEAADIAEQTVSGQTNTMASSPVTTVASSLERSIPTLINTQRLDALVNSTVESHLSPTRNDISKNVQITTTLPLAVTNSTSSVLMNSRDIMLNHQSNLMVPPIINTALSSPAMVQSEIHHISPNLSPEVILNSQISPSLMCRSSAENMLPSANLNAVESNLLQTTMAAAPLLATSSAPPTAESILTAEPEKVLLMSAAVDFLETQKKLSELNTTLPSSTDKCDIISMGSPSTKQALPSNTISRLQATGSTFMQPQFTQVASCSTVQGQGKAEFVMPVNKQMADQSVCSKEKKNEDRMIPTFTSLSENELINFINPSCFDQGNNVNYQ